MKHKSPKKRARQDQIRHTRNHSYKTSVATATKKVLSLVEAGEKEKAEAELKIAQALMDGAVTKGILHRNTVGRKVARIMRRVSSMA